MDFLTVYIPFFPLIAAAVIGAGQFLNLLQGEKSEHITARLSLGAIFISSVLAAILFGADMLGKNNGLHDVGHWLESDQLKIDIGFVATGFSVVLAALFSILLFIVTYFSINYLHRERGFHRFFFILSLFSFAMLFLVLSESIVGTFIGWEIAGLCSYLLIGYAYDRTAATRNSTRVFVTNRIGDAGFILGIAATFAYTGSVSWNELTVVAEQLTPFAATIIGMCFAVAAFAKSVQLPFTTWLGRAMEGPTPSSAVFYGAVMVHAGIFLVIWLQPVIERAPLIMGLLIVVGLGTAIYSFIVGLTQTDVKSALTFAISGQLGLMFLECGLGFWELAAWHLCAHAIVRCYQMLTAPSFMHNVSGIPVKQVNKRLSGLHWLYTVSLQRFWLDSIIDSILVKPIYGLGRDLLYFDRYFVDRALGAPAISERAISSLVQMEQRVLSNQLAYEANDFSSTGNYGVARLFQWTANVMSWFEDRLVIRGIGMGLVNFGRKFGYSANIFEKLIQKPRYTISFVLIVLLTIDLL